MTATSDWTVYLIQVTTGLIGPQVDVDATTWDISLNNNETLKTTVKKSSIPKNLDLSLWLSPWWGGVLLMWRDVPVFAGPIVSRPIEDFNNIDLDCAGIRSILADREVVQEFTDWTQLSSSSISYSGLSLGTIAKRVVQASMQKTGGALPITFPVPEQTTADDANHTRTYEGFDIQNLSCDAVLTKLSTVVNGPDIMFRPRLIDAAHLVWDMWTGTEGQPRISQSQTHIWDTNAVQGPVSDLSIVSTGSYMVNRVYSSGAGTDQGTLITVSEDMTNIVRGFPLLESSIAISQSTDPNVVKAHGDGVLAANLDMLREITLTVRVDGPYSLGTYWPGDLVEIYTKGWITFKDGVTPCRLLTMTGDLSTASDIKLVMQPEVEIDASQTNNTITG